MKNCCFANKKDVVCKRITDKKVFKLPRKFSKSRCLKKVSGFTMRSSCAPYKGCKKRFDVYTNQNPSDTIPIKYKTLEDTKKTIHKLERLYKQKKYSHKRIWQVAMILMVRLRTLRNKQQSYSLAKRYTEFLKKRTKLPSSKRYQSHF